MYLVLSNSSKYYHNLGTIKILSFITKQLVLHYENIVLYYKVSSVTIEILSGKKKILSGFVQILDCAVKILKAIKKKTLKLL